MDEMANSKIRSEKVENNPEKKSKQIGISALKRPETISAQYE